MRMWILATTIGGVYLTTQKGALFSLLLVSTVVCGPTKLRILLLRLLVIAGAVLVIAVPICTNGLVIAQGHGGVFSIASLAERIDDTWPKSLQWILAHQIFPFGTGIGGIGQSQALLGNISQHYPDNMFLLLYAFFGVPCFSFFGWTVFAAIRSISIDPEVAGPALAIVAFELLYGIVVSVVEDQAGPLFIGAALGVLLCATRLPTLRHPVRRRNFAALV
jgi:hypothetical protein